MRKPRVCEEFYVRRSRPITSLCSTILEHRGKFNVENNDQSSGSKRQVGERGLKSKRA